MRKRSVVSLIIILFLLLGTIGCQVDLDDDLVDPNDGNVGEDDGNDETKYKPAYGGTMTVPITYVDTLNPISSGNLSMYYFNKLIFEGLFEFDEKLNVKAQLAEDYTIEGNGRRIVINLRQDVKWHDGEPFTANDVKFTIDVLKYGASKSAYEDLMLSIFKPTSLEDLKHIMNVNVIDDYKLEIAYDRSYSNSLESLVFPIIPMHRFSEGSESKEDQYERALAQEDYQPIGTGPYKFNEYQRLKQISLKVNENWWKGKAYIEEIIGKVLEDEGVTISSFETKIIDLTPTLGVDWEKYDQKDGINIYEYVSQNYAFLGFNFRNQLFQGEKGKAVRKAIALGINRDNIIKKVYLGHATKVDVPVPPDSWLHSDDTAVYDYNADKAREILESAGWQDTNDDGIYEDENGKKLTIRLLTNSYNVLRLKTANMIADYLEEIGIEVVKDYDTTKRDEITEQMAETQWDEVVNKLYTGDFEMTLLEWELSYIPDLSFAFHSSELEEGANIIGYENETMDNLLVRAFRAETREEKAKVYKELEDFLIEELPYVSLYFKNSALLVNNKIKGDKEPKPFNIYYNIEDWYILRDPITED